MHSSTPDKSCRAGPVRPPRPSLHLEHTTPSQFTSLPAAPVCPSALSLCCACAYLLASLSAVCAPRARCCPPILHLLRSDF